MGGCRGWKIPSLFILESNVVRLSPSLEAAPWRPPIIPPAARNVCKIRAASRSRNLPREAIGASGVTSKPANGGHFKNRPTKVAWD
jgi:hypothetical protein